MPHNRVHKMLVAGVYPMNEKGLRPVRQFDGTHDVTLKFSDAGAAHAFINAIREQNVSGAELWNRVYQQVEASGRDSLDPSRIE